jgi:hypothetical protein
MVTTSVRVNIPHLLGKHAQVSLGQHRKSPKRNWIANRLGLTSTKHSQSSSVSARVPISHHTRHNQCSSGNPPGLTSHIRHKRAHRTDNHRFSASLLAPTNNNGHTRTRECASPSPRAPLLRQTSH